MVAGEWEHDLACPPWRSHSGFCAEGWGYKGTEIVMNVQACGKGRPPKVTGPEVAAQPPCLHGHSSHSGCACRASLPFLPIMSACITCAPSDSACPPSSLSIQSLSAKISCICFSGLWTKSLPDGEGQQQAHYWEPLGSWGRNRTGNLQYFIDQGQGSGANMTINSCSFILGDKNKSVLFSLDFLKRNNL